MNLYHYTKISTVIDCILNYKTIHFSTLSGTNDPYENLPTVFSISGNTNGLDVGKELRRTEKLFKTLKSNIKVFCATTDGCSESNNKTGGILYNIDKGFSKPRMWAQYAENGTGVCIVLDSEKFLEKAKTTFSDCEIIAKKINYCSQGEFVNKVSVATSIDASDLLQTDDVLLESIYKKYSDTFFFTKHPDWKDENEMRYLLRERNDVIRDVNVDGIIEAVILGINIDGKNKEKVEKLIRKFDNPPILFQLEFWDGYYQIVPCNESDNG